MSEHPLSKYEDKPWVRQKNVKCINCQTWWSPESMRVKEHKNGKAKGITVKKYWCKNVIECNNRRASQRDRKFNDLI